MEDIQCIFCGRGSDQVIIEENGYRGRKCPRCGLIFISPRPTFTEILNLYAHNHVSAESRISGAFIKRIYAKHNLRIIKKFIKNGSMLEIGPGAGYFLRQARKDGFEVYGIEPNNIQANFIRSKLGIPCVETFRMFPYLTEKKFDIVYHCEVISHFYDPISEFQRINSKLKKNGILVFETGNGGDIKERYYKFFTKFGYPEHLFLFSEDNLKELLRRTGFELIKIYRYSILSQLVISRILKKVIDFIKSRAGMKSIDKHGINGVPSLDFSNFNICGFNFKQLIRNSVNYFLYLARYKIGYIMPKKGRPQTVIVIARKAKIIRRLTKHMHCGLTSLPFGIFFQGSLGVTHLLFCPSALISLDSFTVTE